MSKLSTAERTSLGRLAYELGRLLHDERDMKPNYQFVVGGTVAQWRLVMQLIAPHVRLRCPECGAYSVDLKFSRVPGEGGFYACVRNECSFEAFTSEKATQMDRDNMNRLRVENLEVPL
jgi:hypothetical protein